MKTRIPGRQLLDFITKENASLALLACLINLHAERGGLLLELTLEKKILKLKIHYYNRGMVSTETREELLTTCNQQVMSRCLSAPDATSLYHCLQNHRQYFTISLQVEFRRWTLRGLSKRDLLLLSIQQLCFSSFMGDNQSYASISHTILNSA